MQRKMTYKQGQYLAFIHWYTEANGYPPAEGDMVRYFDVTPPSVHRMVLMLEQRGFISRVPRKPRSIRVLLTQSALPRLERRSKQPAT